ncbi:collectin-11-like [Clytia hemisphaerica]|uniref:C-type lectin domain-containing protein n=1 Tax=Clytia hemisphaerica TaxID=252671 RepID=A0A7M5UMJ1_9CNID
MKTSLAFLFAVLACASATNLLRVRTVTRVYTSSYRIIKTPETWINAQKKCRACGGNLATITNSNDHAYLAAQLKKMKIKSAWVGLNDIKKEKTFVWVAGISAFGGKSGYKKWCPKEPNNNGNEDCVELIASHKAGPCLNDLRCSFSKHKRGYICEIDASRTTQDVIV